MRIYRNRRRTMHWVFTDLCSTMECHPWGLCRFLGQWMRRRRMMDHQHVGSLDTCFWLLQKILWLTKFLVKIRGIVPPLFLLAISLHFNGSLKNPLVYLIFSFLIVSQQLMMVLFFVIARFREPNVTSANSTVEGRKKRDNFNRTRFLGFSCQDKATFGFLSYHF